MYGTICNKRSKAACSHALGNGWIARRPELVAAGFSAQLMPLLPGHGLGVLARQVNLRLTLIGIVRMGKHAVAATPRRIPT